MGKRSAGREVSPSRPAEPAGRVLLASPHGWCAGVDRAVTAVETALERYGPPVYVRRQIVHNNEVVTSLQDRGVIFVDEVSQVPEGAITIFSAHGVAPAVREEAARRDLRTIDATCPLVTKVHQEARRLAARNYDIVLIGQPGHDEVVGTTGQAPAHMHLVSSPGDVPNLHVRDPVKVAWLSQTTLSVEETATVVAKLRERFPALLDPPSEDICYAARNRQLAVLAIAGDSDLMLVVGSANRKATVQISKRLPSPAAIRIASGRWS
jgi:4-hydroxy-3-methylbut-2-en-1-yl diphosphate reductase